MMMFGAIGLLFRPLAALVVLVALALPASAESISTIVERWGLIGDWSADCARPADRGAGIKIAFVIDGGGVVERRDFGEGQDEIDVLSATVANDGVLQIRVFLRSSKKHRYLGLARGSDGALRTVYNRDESGQYTVKEGKFVANGNPAPPLHRCR
jgi:hypothetical protein